MITNLPQNSKRDLDLSKQQHPDDASYSVLTLE